MEKQPFYLTGPAVQNASMSSTAPLPAPSKWNAYWRLMRFDRQFASLTAREFVENVLVKGLNANTVVVGHDFRFGRGREGDADMLRDLGDELGFEEHIVAPVVVDGERVSSSGVRYRLAAGDLFVF